MLRALLLGNGRSRKGLPLDVFRQSGYIIAGCNALYRDYLPHVLMSVDAPMIKEVIRSGITERLTFIKTERNIKVRDLNKFLIHHNTGKRLTKDIKAKSGPSLALVLPLLYPGLKEVYMSGVDFYPWPGETNQNNIYVNTKNYKTDLDVQPHTHKDFQDWRKVFLVRPEVRFFWVRPFKEAAFPRQWANIPNIKVLEAPCHIPTID